MARLSYRKRRSDPNAPKKVPLPWRVFFSEHRQEAIEQNPYLSHNEIMKKLGEMWRQCDEDTKVRYKKQYQTSQIEYDQKLSAYRAEKKNKKQQQQLSPTSKTNNDESQEYDFQA